MAEQGAVIAPRGFVRARERLSTKLTNILWAGGGRMQQSLLVELQKLIAQGRRTCRAPNTGGGQHVWELRAPTSERQPDRLTPPDL